MICRMRLGRHHDSQFRATSFKLVPRKKYSNYQPSPEFSDAEFSDCLWFSDEAILLSLFANCYIYSCSCALNCLGFVITYALFFPASLYNEGGMWDMWSSVVTACLAGTEIDSSIPIPPLFYLFFLNSLLFKAHKWLGKTVNLSLCPCGC